MSVPTSSGPRRRLATSAASPSGAKQPAVIAHSTPWGPHSRYVLTPSAAAVRTPSQKRTASRAWRTQ